MQKSEVNPIDPLFLSEIIQLESGVYAYLDWTTGLIRYNCTGEEYDRIITGTGTKWKHFLETQLHEMYHLFQILTSPYLFNYVSELAYRLWINELNIEDRLVSKIIEGNIHVSDDFLTFIKQVNLPSPQGLTVMHLVEGAAFMAHNRMLVSNNFTKDDFENMLILRENGSEGIYTAAYRYLHESVGGIAYDCLLSFVSASLLTLDPVGLFCALCHQAKKYRKELTEENIPDYLDRFIDTLREQEHFSDLLDTPIDKVDKYKKMHPFYSYTLEKLNKEFSEDEIIYYMCYPQYFPQDLFFSTYRPILFNDTSMLIPKDFESGMFETVDQHEDILKMMTIASYWLMKNHNFGPRFFKSGI